MIEIDGLTKRYGDKTGGHQLGPWNGFAVLCGYAVVLTAAAAWRLRRRDA